MSMSAQVTHVWTMELAKIVWMGTTVAALPDIVELVVKQVGMGRLLYTSISQLFRVVNKNKLFRVVSYKLGSQNIWHSKVYNYFHFAPESEITAIPRSKKDWILKMITEAVWGSG